MNRYNLLIVDDEESITNGLVRVFSKHEKISGVFSALDGEEALSIVRNNKIDIVISDIVLPVINGLDLCRQIYREYPHIKIIMASGYDNFDYARQSLEFKAISYLLKPTSLTDVMDAVQKAINELECVNEVSHNKKDGRFKNIVIDVLDNRDIFGGSELNVDISKPFHMIVIISGEEIPHNRDIAEYADRVCAREYINRDIFRISGSNNIMLLTDTENINKLCDDLFMTLLMVLGTQPVIEKSESLMGVDDCIKRYCNICIKVNSVIEFIKKYIRDNLNREITLKEISTHVHMNVNYLSSYFKKNTGMNFSDYIAQEKIAKAKFLLVSTDDKCYEIARKVGYVNQRNFSSFFKNMTGFTPLEFKERYYGK